ncbi:CPSF2 [Lepeophtheirus salmonis]|uniref:Cleavage and polyadenylation specificity factor subunit 2 n=1 Tax=Lepeophtheirus salmonis TaxID=72036 RepID=A0A7R8CF58_LEPSM|nr:CPSF2 [Lepeophtheirus salmonis]CAF2803217.1 CPSF2 [Lepeophtheirus salmonis]
MKAKFPIFPTHEEKIRWDDYGEIVRSEDWLDISQSTENSNVKQNNEIKDDRSNIQSEVPTKCVTSKHSFHIKAQIQFIDFEGRSEGDSILKLLQQIKPRKVIVVRGTPEKCDTLKNFCEQIALKGDQQRIDVYSPENGEVLDVTTESFIYQVRLTESLVKSLEYSTGKDGSQLAWVDGVINLLTDDSADIIPDEEDDAFEEPSLKKTSYSTIRLSSFGSSM